MVVFVRHQNDSWAIYRAVLIQTHIFYKIKATVHETGSSITVRNPIAKLTTQILTNMWVVPPAKRYGTYATELMYT